MTGDAEVVFLRDLVAEPDQFIALEFNEPLAFRAVQVIVLGIAVIMFVDGASIERESAEQSGFDEFRQGSVNRRAANVVGVAPLREFIEQHIDIEMRMLPEHMIDEQPLRPRHAFAATLEKLLKTLERGRGDGHIAQGRICHGFNRLAGPSTALLAVV